MVFGYFIKVFFKISFVCLFKWFVGLLRIIMLDLCVFVSVNFIFVFLLLESVLSVLEVILKVILNCVRIDKIFFLLSFGFLWCINLNGVYLFFRLIFCL